MRRAKLGTATIAGRPRTLPSAFASSRLVTGLGDVMLTGPTSVSVESANTMAARTSSIAIQLTYWLPLPMWPPRPSRNGGSIFASAAPGAGGADRKSGGDGKGGDLGGRRSIYKK